MPRHVLTYFLVAAGFLIGSADSSANNFTIFDSNAYIRGTHKALPQWEMVVQTWGKEKEQLTKCEEDFAKCESNTQIGLNAFLSRLSVLSDYEKLAEANSYANSQPTDPKHHNWKSPLAFLEDGGSEEDKVILKYFLLKKAGFPAGNFRLLLAEDPLSGSRQMMLVVKDREDVKILSDQGSAILNQDDLSFFVPIISWNDTARWIHIPRQFVSKGVQ